MEVWVDPKTGLRNREFRPYIDQEELGRNVHPYDPNRSPQHGLYDQAHPSCLYWQDLHSSHPTQIPSHVIDKTGRMYNYPSKHSFRYDSRL